MQNVFLSFLFVFFASGQLLAATISFDTDIPTFSKYNIYGNVVGVRRTTDAAIADRTNTFGRRSGSDVFVLNSDPAPPTALPKPPVNFLSFDSFKRGAGEVSVGLAQASFRALNGAKIFVYRSGDFGIPKNGALCAFQASACVGDFVLDFAQPIVELMFSGFFAKTSDSSIVSLFDGDALIYSNQFFGNSDETILFDFSTLGKVTKVSFTDASNASTRGIAYGKFSYRVYSEPETPAAVPIPATAFLLITSLLLLSFFPIGARRALRLS